MNREILAYSSIPIRGNTTAGKMSVAFAAATAVALGTSAIAHDETSAAPYTVLMIVFTITAISLGIAGAIISKGSCRWSWGGIVAGVGFFAFVAYAIS